MVWPEVERGLSGDAGRTALTLPSVIYPIGKGAVALGQPRRGRSTDRGCSRHDSGVEPDEGAESERAVGRADEAEIRREEEQTDGGAAAESRPAELPGEPSEAKGCRGGARAVRNQSSKNRAGEQRPSETEGVPEGEDGGGGTEDDVSPGRGIRVGVCVARL